MQSATSLDQLTDAEARWVQLALRHRRRAIWIKAFAISLIYLAALTPFTWFAIAIAADIQLPLTEYHFEIWMVIFCLSANLFLAWVIWYTGRQYAVPLSDIWRSARVSKLLSPTPIVEERGQITLQQDDDWIATVSFLQQHNLAIPLSANTLIQVPRHWKHRLPSGSCNMRCAVVDADNSQVWIKSVIRGGMTPGGSVMRHQVTQTPLANPSLVLLSAGHLSVTKEVQADLGLPRFDSRRWWDLCIIPAILGGGSLFFGWVVLPDIDPVIGERMVWLALPLTLPLVIKITRRLILRHRMNRLYS